MAPGSTGSTLLKGAFVGALAGVCTGFLEGALAAAHSLILHYCKGRGSTSSLPMELQHELHRMLELALDSPQLLLTGRHARRFRRLLEFFSQGELPWQLVLIHQRLEAAIDAMPYEQRYALFGGNAPPPPASEGLLKQLPKVKLTRHQVARKKGPAGQDIEARCPICLQEWAAGDVACTLQCCDHTYHYACVGKWLRKSSTCPTCRHQVQQAR